MTSRILDETDLQEILEGLRRQLNQASNILTEVEDNKRTLSHKLFHLQFRLVSPLYYRLQRHLIDWCVREEHPHLSSLEITKIVD